MSPKPNKNVPEAQQKLSPKSNRSYPRSLTEIIPEVQQKI